MAKIGYARVSSKEQNLDRQLQALESVSKVFTDKMSGATTERPQLQAMLDYIRDGDIVVVAELDRLGRNNKRFEFVPVQSMEKAMQVIVKIAESVTLD